MKKLHSSSRNVESESLINFIAGLILFVALLGFIAITLEIQVFSDTFVILGAVVGLIFLAFAFIFLFKLGFDYKGWILTSIVLIAVFFITVRYFITLEIIRNIGFAFIGFLVGVCFILWGLENSLFVKSIKEKKK